MKSKIIQEFLGEIGNVQFDDKNVYYSTSYLLETIEDKFGEVYTEEFVEELRNTISTMYLKYEGFSYNDLEQEFYYCIDEASNFEGIKFDYFGSDWKIEDLNKGITEGIYTQQNLGFGAAIDENKNTRNSLEQVKTLFIQKDKENPSEWSKEYIKQLEAMINTFSSEEDINLGNNVYVKDWENAGEHLKNAYNFFLSNNSLDDKDAERYLKQLDNLIDVCNRYSLEEPFSDEINYYGNDLEI